ncbi:hypothetical protein UVI_02042570 [Ustilaginoidea virens]|nr:hypothetical protein UVI_02042570 [Ustilaginoidea virens]
MVAPFRVIAGPKSKSSWFIPVGPLNSIEDIAADVFLFRELHSLKAHFAIRQVLQQKVYSGIIAIMWESQVPFVSKQVQICGQTRLITAESPRNCRLCGQSHSCRDCEDATGGKSLGPVQWTSREPGEYVATKVAGGVAQMKLLAGEGAKRKEKKRKRESHIPKVPNVNKVVEDLMNV